MNTTNAIAGSDADVQAVLDHLSSGTPLDPESAKRVRERGQEIRQEIFQQHGILDIGVPAIRELRGELSMIER